MNFTSIKVFCWIIFFVLFCSFSIYSSDEFNEPVTLKADNKPLSEVLKIFKQQTGITFVYADIHTDIIKVTCSFSNKPIHEALTEILFEKDISFKRTDKKQITLIFSQKIFNRTITGVIIDSQSEETLPNANITVIDTKIGTSTNPEGRFTILKVPVKNCILQVQYIGYMNKTIHIPESDSSITDFKIYLYPVVLYQEEILVEDEFRKNLQILEQPSNFTVSPQDFSTLPRIGDKDVLRDLQLIPGICVSHYGSSGINIRNGLSSQNLILLDGITLYHMDHVFGFFSALNPSVIKDIRIYKGGFPAQYGGRVSGVIDLIVKNGNLSKPVLKIGLNQMNGQAMLELPIFFNGAFLISVRRWFPNLFNTSLHAHLFSLFDQNTYSVYWAKPNKSPSALDTQSDQEISFYDLFSKMTILPSKNDVISFSYFAGLDKISKNEEYTDKYQSISSESKIDLTSNWGSWGYSIKWYRQWCDNLNSVFLFSYSDYFNRFSLRDIYISENKNIYISIINFERNINNRVKNLSWKIDNAWQISDYHQTEFGILFSDNDIYYNLDTKSKYGYSDDSSQFTQDAFSSIVSTYIQDSWELSENFHAVIGLRTNYFKLIGTINWEPRLSFRISLSSRLSIKGAWGRYYQYVMQYNNTIKDNLGSNSWIMADARENIEPCFAEHYIIGGSIEDENSLFDLEFYYKKLTNILSNLDNLQNNSSFITGDQIEQNKGYSSGAELLFQKKIGQFTGWLSYSYSKSRILITDENNESYIPSEQDIPYNFSIVGDYRYNNWSFAATWQYISGTPYSIPFFQKEEDLSILYYKLGYRDINKYRLPDRCRLDFSITKTFSSSWVLATMGISFYNILSQRNILNRFYEIRDSKIHSIDVYDIARTITLFIEFEF